MMTLVSNWYAPRPARTAASPAGPAAHLADHLLDVALARRFATRIVGMSTGRVVFDGPPEDLADRHLTEIYGRGEAGEWIG